MEDQSNCSEKVTEDEDLVELEKIISKSPENKVLDSKNTLHDCIESNQPEEILNVDENNEAINTEHNKEHNQISNGVAQKEIHNDSGHENNQTNGDTIEAPLSIDDYSAEQGLQLDDHKFETMKPNIRRRFLKFLLTQRELIAILLGCFLIMIGIMLILYGSMMCNQYSSKELSQPLDSTNGTHLHGDELHVTYFLKNQHVSDGEKVNLALGKESFQSSVSSEGEILYRANLAVDNNTDNYFHNKDCAQTEQQSRPYWYVNLEETFLVRTVKMVLPKDCCVADLHNFEVRVGDNHEFDLNHLCKHHMGTALKTMLNIKCDEPIFGRYVSIQMLGDEIRTTDKLTLCEIMVFT